MEKKADPNRMFVGLLSVVIGLLVFFGGCLTPLNELSFYIILEVGLMLVGLGLVRIALTMHFMEKLRRLEELKRDTKAIGWQLAVFFATIPAVIFAWFVAAWPTDMVWTLVTGIVTFSGAEAAAINLVRQITALLIGVAIFFSIMWLWVNAHRRAETV